MNITDHVPALLVIDDSDLYQKIFLSAFAGSKVFLHTCHTASEALQAMREKPFHMVVSSMVLKDMDGIALCRAMRELKGYLHTPFILCTTYDSNTVGKQALPAGVTDIFNKWDIQELITFVERFIHHESDPIVGRVLYIEDNLSQRLLTSQTLAWWGMSVDDYTSAEQALPAFLNQDYDLVITDIVLEGVMTGLQLVNRIRRIHGPKGDVPILAITAFDDIARRIELFNQGVTDYVIKPVITEELVSRVRNILSP